MQQALLEGGRVQADAQHAAPLHRVWAGPQQVAEQRVLAGPGQLVAEELAAETAVIELQVPAVVVSVPDAGAQQDDIPAGKLLPTGQRVVNALAAGRKNNLHEAVRVQRVALLVKVIAGVGE